FQVPAVDERAEGASTEVQGEGVPAQNGMNGESQDTLRGTGGFLFGFEIDFWGRFRRGTEAARADLLASEAARRFVITTLVSDVAAAYFNIRDLDLELEIARRTLASRIDSLRLVTMREQGGVAAMIDVR